MNILYIAYSCSPNSGSEDAIGWNVPLEMSNRHNVFVITKEEHKKSILVFLESHPNCRLHFYFVDVSSVYKKLFTSFLYSGRLIVWNNKAIVKAQQICEKYHIDIIHQITPVEFRAIGDYGKIRNVKFVVGPLGGGENIPNGLRSYAIKHFLTEFLRKAINEWFREFNKISGKYKYCDYLLFANKETKKYLGLNGKLLTEIAINKIITPRKLVSSNNKIIFLWAGRMIYRKGLDFLFDVIERLPENAEYEVRLVGTGPELQRLFQRWKDSNNLRNHVSFVGTVSYDDMSEEYSKANVFIMPSIRETTGTVILEAMSHGLPVIAINHFGSALLLKDDYGWLYSGKIKDDYLKSLEGIMLECINHHNIINQKRINAFNIIEHYTWCEKVKIFEQIYLGLVK